MSSEVTAGAASVPAVQGLKRGRPVSTMHIGQLAERAEMSLRTIRHYDETGLLRPSGRTEGGFRLYTEVDLERLLVIRRMKPLGFSLDEMGQLLSVVDRLAATDDPVRQEGLREELRAFTASAHERRADLARKLGMADEFIGLLQRL